MDTELKLPDVPSMGNSDDIFFICKEDEEELTDKLNNDASAKGENECFEQKLLETKLKIAESTGTYNYIILSTFSLFLSLFPSCLFFLWCLTSNTQPEDIS